MSQHLSYIQIVVNGGHTVVEPGVVRTDQVDRLGRKHPLHGHGVRLYQADRMSEGISLKSMSLLIFNVRRVMQDVVFKLANSSLHSDVTAKTLVTMVGERSCFASLDLVKDDLQILELSSHRSLDDAVEKWASTTGFNHILVEWNSSIAALRSLERQIASDVPSLLAPRASKGAAAESSVPALPIETETAAQRRAALARDWLDASGVNTLLGSKAANKSQLPTRLRQTGKILGVWVVSDNCYRFPPWQFNQNQVIPEFRDILHVLRSEHGVAGGRKTSGWEEIEWLCAPHALLAKQRPSDLLVKTPGRVLEVARKEFMENPDASW